MERAKLFGVLIIISVLIFVVYNAWKPVPDQTVSRKNLKNISKNDTATKTKPAAGEKDNGRNVDRPIPPVPEMPKELPKEEKPKVERVEQEKPEKPKAKKEEKTRKTAGSLF